MIPPTTSRVEVNDKKRYPPSVHETPLEDTSDNKRRKKEYSTPQDGSVGGGGSSTTTEGFSSKERETDAHRIRQRLKQVEYGKNTVGYDRYTRLLHRKKRRLVDPHTPDAYKKMSKRAFDGLCREWRRKLHEWDEPTDKKGVALAKEIMQLNKEIHDAEEELQLPIAESTSVSQKDKSAKIEFDINSSSDRFSSDIYCESTVLDNEEEEVTISESHLLEHSDADLGADTGAVLSDDDLL